MIDLVVSTLNFVRNLFDVVLRVKYVADESEASWLQRKEFENQAAERQQKALIRISRANRLTQDTWGAIADHVAAVHH